jgi:peptidoglycan/xylan/chitin deacetylase (PgdA/CDA1 family)
MLLSYMDVSTSDHTPLVLVSPTCAHFAAIRCMKNQHKWRVRAAALICVGLVSGCVSQPVPVPQQNEQALGAPLPYEPPLTGLQVAPALPPVAPEVVNHGLRRKKKIALTFDACSTQRPGQFDERVIHTLIDMQVPATLFLGGKWMEEHPDETMELGRYPQFELANHTYLHPHLPRESDERVHEELIRTQDMLYTLTGRRATLFRAPYGELDARVVRHPVRPCLRRSGPAHLHETPDRICERPGEERLDRGHAHEWPGLAYGRGLAAHRAALAQEGLQAGNGE